ncbi:hypothetical protein COO91_00100 [Nostoc flagelliforme CCNUN1]|uniref:Uncharacterized protein n=1 Tax=Nostoc flagelliforme CCNUN1 TaxID=2038116 RepID=A0A2K8SG31_9NOSO|nr:hypothetical protein COO91_00036 [Nostoc flagelliforme CCNUN1]AUB34284.1 hypothetical protein COO91_00100 [Nostoc flagelliforme CCNUN1]
MQGFYSIKYLWKFPDKILVVTSFGVLLSRLLLNSLLHG